MPNNERAHSLGTEHPTHQNAKYVNIHSDPVIIFITRGREVAAVMYNHTTGEVEDMHYCDQHAEYEAGGTVAQGVCQRAVDEAQLTDQQAKDFSAMLGTWKAAG